MEIYAVAENIGVSYLMFYNSSRAEESVRPPRGDPPSLGPAPVTRDAFAVLSTRVRRLGGDMAVRA